MRGNGNLDAAERRLAVQLAGQLPECEEAALRVLGLCEQLVMGFLCAGAAVKRDRTLRVVSSRGVAAAAPAAAGYPLPRHAAVRPKYRDRSSPALRPWPRKP